MPTSDYHQISDALHVVEPIASLVLLATLWRLFRGSTVREEIRRALDSLFSGSPHA